MRDARMGHRAVATGVAIGLLAISAQAVGAASTDVSLEYPVEGTRWRLVSTFRDGVERPVGPEVTAWIRARDGSVEGSTGCSSLQGRYRLASGAAGPDPALAPPQPVDGALSFEDVGSSGRTCAEQAMLVGSGLLEGFSRATGYRITPGASAWQADLVIVDVDGEPALRFRVDDPGTLAGTTWLLESVDGAPGLPSADGQPIVLILDEPRRRSGSRASARLSGSTGCDTFSGTYAVTGDVLSVGELARSGTGCPASLAEQDARIVSIIDATSLRVSLPPGALELRSDDDGGTLVYRSSPTLEDQTWVLIGRAGTPFRGDRVATLYLAPTADTEGERVEGERVGTVSGRGPCRPVEGTYRTNGVLIALDVRGAGRRCADRAAERRYLRDLRDAAFVQVGGKGLSLRDGQGRIVTSYAAPGSP